MPARAESKKGLGLSCPVGAIIPHTREPRFFASLRMTDGNVIPAHAGSQRPCVTSLIGEKRNACIQLLQRSLTRRHQGRESEDRHRFIRAVLSTQSQDVPFEQSEDVPLGGFGMGGWCSKGVGGWPVDNPVAASPRPPVAHRLHALARRGAGTVKTRQGESVEEIPLEGPGSAWAG